MTCWVCLLGLRISFALPLSLHLIDVCGAGQHGASVAHGTHAGIKAKQS